MLASIRFTAGLGNAAIYVRLRDAAGRYAVLASGAWQDVDDAAARAYLVEFDDADAVDSRYQATIALGFAHTDTVLEYVLEATGAVIGEDSFAATAWALPSEPAGLLASVAELKAYARITSSADDDELARILAAASALFLSETGRTLADLDPVPADVTQAILDQAALWHAGRGRAGVQAETSPVGGSTSYVTRDLSIAFRSVVDLYRSWSL